MLYDAETVIGPENFARHINPHMDHNGVRAFGCIPRPPGMKYKGEMTIEEAKAVDLVSFDPSEFPTRIKELEDSGSRLSDYRMKMGQGGGMIPSRDQNGRGYCWAHSGVSAHLLIRARDEMPYVSLSAYAIACIIKSYRDEGGWGAEGLDFQFSKGCPSDSFWPQQSVSRANDKPATWENAALHKVTEGWIDMGAAQYDRTLTFNQMITCLLCRVPVICDFNWWSHSVCGCDAVNGASQFKKTRNLDSGKLLLRGEFDRFWGMNNPVTGGIALRIWNSWGDGWSSQGMGVLTGSQAVPDGAVAPRVVMWSAA